MATDKDYVIAVGMRSGSITSIDGPSGSGVTGATPDMAYTSGSGSSDYTVALFKVRPTSAVSGDWTINQTGATYASSILYQISAQATILGEDGGSNTGGLGEANVTTTEGDLVIAVSASGNALNTAVEINDPVTLYDCDTTLSSHNVYAYSGAADGGTNELVWNGTSGSFKDHAFGALVLE